MEKELEELGIRPEEVDDESDFFYDDDAWESCCEDAIEECEDDDCR